jgi:general secretion pathway protein J
MKNARLLDGRVSSENDGFTMFEALIAVALMGFILAILATVTGQWLPAWKAGFARVQQTDLLGLGLDRIVADLAASEFISLASAGDKPLFEGSSSSATLVRSAIGPNAAGGLEIVRLADDADEGGLVRARTAFTPTADKTPRSGEFEFSDATILVRHPLRVSFAFAGRDRSWKDKWSNDVKLPTAIRVTVRNGDTDQVLAVSTATLLHVTAPANCVTANSAYGCIEQLENGRDPRPTAGNRS